MCAYIRKYLFLTINVPVKKVCSDKMDDFPFFAKYSPLSEEELIEALIAYQPVYVFSDYNLSGYRLPPRDDKNHFIPFRRGQKLFFATPLYIDSSSVGYDDLEGLTDFFTEDIRILAKKKDKISAREAWDERYKTKYSTKDEARQLRDAIFTDPDVREPTLFRLSWAKGIYMLAQQLIGKEKLTVLDISAGWGDRLLAASSLGLDYVGYDPNKLLYNGHSRIMDVMGVEQVVIYSPFEDSALLGQYDFIFTSPPFFDLEEYSQDESQSVVRYPNFEVWRDDFFIRSLNKAWSVLLPGGYMAIHISNYGDINLVQYMLDNLTNGSFPDLSYVGVVGVKGGRGKTAPVWWFRKNLPTISRIFDISIQSANRDTELVKFYHNRPVIVWEPSNVEAGNIEERFYNSTLATTSDISILWGTKDYLDILYQAGHGDYYQHVRDVLFPQDRTGSRKFANRAGDKLYEVMELSQTLPDYPINFVDLAGGPGAFSEVLLSLNKKNRGWGMTLKGDMSWYPHLLKNNRFRAVWGPGKNGDLYNIDNVFDLQKQTSKVSIDVVVADGGIASIENYQEVYTGRLLLAETFAALLVLSEGGTFICKFFDTFTELTVSLLAALRLIFTRVQIIKPIKSRLVNSERYVVCEDFRLQDERLNSIYSVIEIAYQYSTNNRTPRSLIPISDTEFERKMRILNQYFPRAQSKSMREIISIIQRLYGQTMHLSVPPQCNEIRYDITKSLTSIE